MCNFVRFKHLYIEYVRKEKIRKIFEKKNCEIDIMRMYKSITIAEVNNPNIIR